MDWLFPFYKRATSIGICNFVARCFTIGAPMVAELEAPLPTAILIVVNLVAFSVIFTLPTTDSDEEEKVDYEEK